jgi:hypothetical protein
MGTESGGWWMVSKDRGVLDKPKADRRWHAVSVKPGQRACAAATSGRELRWLSREAPMLPLPGCTQPDSCHCTYSHHDDRRSGSRRANEMDAFVRPVKVVNERRRGRNRRSTPDE